MAKRFVAGALALLLAAAAAAAQNDPGLDKALHEEFDRRFTAVDKKDVKALASLAEWAEKSKLGAEAKKVYKAILEVDPDHAAAREKLGFVRVEGEWVTKEKAAELAKKKGADPKKKPGPAPPKGPGAGGSGTDVDRAIAENAASDAAESKRLSAVLGDGAVVLTSRHFSLRGALTKELARDALALAEQAYSELNAIFENPNDDPSPFSMAYGRKLHCIYAKDESAVREVIPYVEQTFGKLSPALKADIQKNGTGMAARGHSPIAISHSNVDIRTHVLHELGQTYIDGIMGGAPAWLAEGFAIYTAVRWGGKNTSYCQNLDNYKGSIGKARKGEDTSYLLLCKESAEDKNDTPIEELNKKEMNQLDDKDLAKAFSIVRICLEKEPDKGLAFLRLFDPKSVARCLKVTFRMTPAQFDTYWREQFK